MTFDPRIMSKHAYEALQELRSLYDEASKESIINDEEYNKHLQEQKSQAVELYSYISTWGLMRLKGEEISLDKWQSNSSPTIQQKTTQNQEGKREVIESYFSCLEKVSKTQKLANHQGLNTLKDMNHNQYLGLTGLALAMAQEFSFWADAVYHDIKSGESLEGRSN